MSIKINSMLDTTNNLWEVSLGGELDVSTADELKKELHKLVDEKNIDMRLNLENLDYIDSTGLGVIIGILKRLKIESINALASLANAKARLISAQNRSNQGNVGVFINSQRGEDVGINLANLGD